MVLRLLVVGMLAAGLATRVWAFGNVTATLSDGKLTIDGDEAPNAIDMGPGVEVGSVVIVGREGTAINGSPAAAFVGVERIVGSMKAGADRVDVQSLDLEEAFKFTLGGDNDAFSADGLSVAQNVEIKGGTGADEITVRGEGHVGGQLFVKGGKDADTLEVIGMSVSDGLEVGGGGSADAMLVQGTTVDDREITSLRGGGGDDVVVLVDDDFEGDLEVKLGSGDDDLSVDGTDFDGRIFADGGDGHDELAVGDDNSYDLSEPRVVVNFEDLDAP